MTDQSLQRRLAAIVVADVVGYSRLMEADEVATLANLRELRSGVIEPAVMRHNGRIFKEGLPEEIQSDPEVQELYLGGGHE